jgi:hypothetical protein
MKSKTFPEIAVQVPQVMIPRQGVDLSKWAVVACDQYTSEPEYWQQVEKIVSDAPSTLRLTLPEVYLGKPGEEERVQNIRSAMRAYMAEGLFEPRDGMVLVERQVGGRLRRGLMMCLDLEKYNYNKGADTLIRATEGTIVDRLPPRMKIREGALLEFPHILVLIDDPLRTVIEPIAQAKDRLTPLYDFDLMMKGGHLAGYLVEDAELEAQVIHALEGLAVPQTFAAKYDISSDQPVMLFAMGDGNHSLATAKAIWEKVKPQVGMDHPARYALVEVENVHDQGLEFEPIHRVLFGVKTALVHGLKEFFGSNYTLTACESAEQMLEVVENGDPTRQTIGVAADNHFSLLQIHDTRSNLAVGKLQPFLDDLLKKGEAQSIDYLHGTDVFLRLSSEEENLGFFLPKMNKSDLFKTVIMDGALPRKTFSMGEAHEKRYYMEGRVIS